MLGRFTDNARAVVKESFRRGPVATEGDILAAIVGRPDSLAARVLMTAGLGADQLPTGGLVTDRASLVSRAVAEARRRGAKHVGTEHVLLAVCREGESGPCGLGVAARLDALVSAAEAGWRRAHPSPARRIGTAFRAVWCRFRGRGA